VYVKITGNTSAGAITTSVEVLKNTSTLVKTPAPGFVYKNMNIWVGTSGFAVPKNIKTALIGFKVDNSWIKANGLSSSDIKLLKWDGGQWIQLETKQKEKFETYTIFEGETNRFSPFAISGKVSEITSGQTSQDSQLTTNPTSPESTVQELEITTPPDTSNEAKILKVRLIASALILIVIIGVIIYVSKKIKR
jgi:PGF-pre-PGF domain-containing protein